MDDALLDRARTILGTTTKRATVNEALQLVVALQARREFLADARRGELQDAADSAVMDAAWRR